jgi:hypothetical protein
MAFSSGLFVITMIYSTNQSNVEEHSWGYHWNIDGLELNQAACYASQADKIYRREEINAHFTAPASYGYTGE